MKDAYTPAEANIWTLRVADLGDTFDVLSSSPVNPTTPGGSGGIGDGGYDPGGWT